MNFYFAAFTYLYEWVCYDRYFMDGLNFRGGPEPESEEACKQLIAVATHYNVVRNFKAEEQGTVRLLPVWNALKGMGKPVSQEDAKDWVDQLVVQLRVTYERDLPSAASKMLWMRFGSPIVIFDSLTLKWIREKGGFPKCEGYSDFYDAWQKNFKEYEAKITEACAELNGLKTARKFFDPGGIDQQKLEEAVLSRWFAERVFDHALLNAQTFER